jgi:hemolysin activation/secretion protein
MRRLCLAALLICAGSPAGAQTAPGSPTNLMIDQARLTPAAAPPPTPPATNGTPDHLTSVDAGAGGSGPIAGIRFDGVEVPRSVGVAATPFIGRPATRDTLKTLAEALSDAYGRSSIALYTVAIPAQSFAGGILHVRIAEGFVEQAVVTGDVSHRSVRLVQAYARRLALERPLRKASLQRYLSLIRDIPGLSVEARLLKGGKPGGVKLVLILKQRTHDLSISFDNQTQRQLADGQFQAVGKLYGALRPGDETDLTLGAASNFRAYRYAGLSHATPLGTDGTRATASFAHLATRTRGFHIRGDADVGSLGVSHPLIRSYTRNLTLSATMDLVNSDNAVLGSLLSRERTRAMRGAAIFSDVGKAHLLTASLTLSRGLDLLGADTRVTGTDRGFTKLSGQAALTRSFGRHWIARVKGAGQWTQDSLPAIERFIVGGSDFGRAYPVAALAADRGLAGSAELAWRPGVLKALQNSEFYAFADKARVRYLANPLYRGATFRLASAGAGVRIAYRDRNEVDVEAARRIERPYPGLDKDWQINLAWRLSFGK